MTILELREKRNKAWEAAKAFVETKRDKDGLLSDEDAKTYAEMEQKVQNYTSEIERMQAMEAMEAELNKPVNTPITHKPMNSGKDTGDGVGKPLGIFAETGGAEIGVTAASATEITSDEIINLVYALKRPYRKSAKFIMNDQTIAAIRKLKDENGQYLWQPSNQVGEPGKLFGYDVLTSPFVPTIAAGKPVIAFGDFSYYNIGDRGTRSFAELRELYAGNGMVGFVAKERVDGKLVLPEAVQVLKMGA